MAKAKILDDKVVITSDILTDANISKVSILKPSVLILKDEETGENLFEVAVSDCNAVTDFGAVFTKGKAIGKIKVNEEDKEVKKEKIKTIITASLLKINAIENQVSEFLDTTNETEVDIDFLD